MIVALLLTATWLAAAAAKLHVQQQNLTLCNTQFTLLTVSNVQDSPFANPLHFVNLHRNENTSIAAARAYIQLRGGTLSYMRGTARLLTFECAEFPAPFVVDPNRMFTDAGITASLLKYGTLQLAPKPVIAAVAAFAKQWLTAVGFASVSPIVAVHNNGADGISAKSYQPGGQFASDARLVTLADAANPRDFFLVTQAGLYTSLKSVGDVNVVLASSNATDDGSLSYYCSLKKKNYVNIEAAAANDHDGARLAAQVRMLGALGDVRGNEQSCATWKLGAIAGGFASAAMAVLMLFLTCLICRQRSKAAGYEAIDGQYASY